MAHQQPTTIAILGPSTLAEYVLRHLLEGEGYAVRLLKAPPVGSLAVLPEGGSVEELLESVDVVLLWPSPTLRDKTREAFVEAMKSAPATARIPLVALTPSLQIALQDELGVEVPLERQFAQLVRVLEDVLASPAGSVDTVDLAGGPGRH